MLELVVGFVSGVTSMYFFEDPIKAQISRFRTWLSERNQDPTDLD